VHATLDQPAWVDQLDEWHLLTPLKILLVVLVAWIIARLVRRLVNRLLSRITVTRDDPGRTTPRARAVATVVRGVVLAVVWFIAVVVILSYLGVDLSGVVVTASIVGGALAFGAQTLVRDVISGFFVLTEDQYGLGDVIDLGVIGGGADRIVGTCERITLRATRVRDGEGRVWHVPNGNIQRVANLSLRSLAVLDLQVDRDSRLADVEAKARRLAAALVADPRSGPLLTGDVDYIGLAELRDDRLVVRLNVTTYPGQHDVVRRVWRELAHEAFLDHQFEPPAAQTLVIQEAHDTHADTSGSE
jgi:small conductance mechanosensitive channel